MSGNTISPFPDCVTAPAGVVGASLLLLLLLLVACPPLNEEPVGDDPVDPIPTEEPAPAPNAVALCAECVNEEIGFRVAYPEEWVVNEGDGLPACSAFDLEDASVPEVGEIPSNIAVVIHDPGVEFERATDFDEDFTVEVITRGETTVDGRPAITAELRSTGEGMYPEGHLSYSYYVDLGPNTLQAITHDVPGAEPGFEERRRILDAMMSSLEFVQR